MTSPQMQIILLLFNGNAHLQGIKQALDPVQSNQDLQDVSTNITRVDPKFHLNLTWCMSNDK
jgi:hypothetical protein